MAMKAVLSILPKSSSAKSLKMSIENKRGLSFELDQVLKEGVHDMRVFGLGFLRSCADKQSYVQFTTGMFHYYSTMENCFDRGTGVVNQVWSRFPELRRSEKLHKDLLDIGAVPKTQDPQSLPISAATAAYCHDIKAASQVDGGTPLLGHLYVRYFADLFGGRMLGTPTRLALPELRSRGHPPHFYTWDASVEHDRHAYIERVYAALNEAGDAMDPPRRARVVEEARRAFRHNAAVYTEDPGMVTGAVRGALRIAAGGVRAMTVGG